jgi:cytochrome c
MKIRTGITVLTLLLMLAGTELYAGQIPKGPGLGKPAGAHAVGEWNLTVMPDGKGLPPGGGDAVQGGMLYRQQCRSCHGKGGLGNSGDQLAGARKSLTSDYPEKTIGTYWPYAPTLFDFIRRSMPMKNPGSLSNDQVYALCAYLLYLNGIIGRTDEMNARTLPAVKMPNRNGFIDMYPAPDPHGQAQ